MQKIWYNFYWVFSLVKKGEKFNALSMKFPSCSILTHFLSLINLKIFWIFSLITYPEISLLVLSVVMLNLGLKISLLEKWLTYNKILSSLTSILWSWHISLMTRFCPLLSIRSFVKNGQLFLRVLLKGKWFFWYKYWIYICIYIKVICHI